MTSKRRKWALILLGLIAVVALVAYVTREREPSYKGRSLGQWIVTHADEASASQRGGAARHEGADAIRQIGTNALPTLLLWIAAEPPPDIKLPGILGRLPLGSWSLDSFDAADARAGRAMLAFYGFAVLGDQARPAVPELAGLLRKGKSVWHATAALSVIGSNGVPALTDYLADTNALNRQQVLELFRITPSLVRDDRLIQQFRACLTDPDVKVRSTATNIFQQIAP